MQAIRDVDSRPGPPGLTRREGLLAVAFGVWLVVGLFVDGWAHNHAKPESIFTPWHALFYSGFLATAFHALGIVRRRAVPGRRRAEAIPPGHALVLAGLAVFATGAAGDLVWHSLFGIEVDIEALLSPTHLVMFGGGLLILTGPFRAAWADPTEAAPTLRRFLPALASLTLTSALVAFFFMYLTPFRPSGFGPGVADYTAAVTTQGGAAFDYAQRIQVVGIASILITTVLLLAPLLLVLRRWRPPFGTGTVLFSVVTAGIGGIDGFEIWLPLLAAPVAGLAADLLIARLRPSPARPWALRVVAGAVPVVLWLAFFGLFQLAYGLGWSPELWAGVTLMAALAGAGLSLLVVPPAVPARAA